MRLSSQMPRALLAVSALLTLAANCSAENQKSADYLEGEEPIALLDGYANPRPTDADVQAFITARAAGDVRVAVIDNGVDYTHPGLVGRTEFDVEGPFLKGVGFDAMGDDAFGHPNLINPALFAFGAQAIVDGRIKGPSEDPLGLIARLDAEFKSELFAALAADEVLMGSLFSKLTPEAISVFGAMTLLELEPFDADDYADRKETEEFLSAASRAKLDPEDKDHAEPRYRFLLDYPWHVHAVNGLPRFNKSSKEDDTLWALEHADRFAALLASSFAAFDARTGFKAKFDTYARYVEARLESKDGTADDRLGDDLQALQTAYAEFTTGGVESDETLTFARRFCSELLDEPTYQKLRDPSLAQGEKEALVLLEIERYFAWATEVDRMIQDNRPLFGASAVLGSKARTPRVEGRRAAARAFLADKGLANFTCATLEPRFSDAEAVKAYRRTYSHPYLSGSSVGNAHGTHVSGIIISQSPAARIVPVRVTMESVETTSAKLAATTRVFSEGFAAWMKLPAVRPSLRSLLPALAAGDTDDAFDAQALALFEPLFESEVEKSPLDFVFIDDIVRAIRYVGEKKIKVANVSLGTTFESAPASSLGTTVVDISEQFKFLRYEYFKYAIAKAMKDHAAQTLFVIAAGNDGNWVDGNSRSALPCDLSSSFLARFEATAGKAPNNAIDNVLCVGSIGPSDSLSAFTNLTITKVPFVLSYGEAVLSSLRQGNCEGSDQAFEAQSGAGLSYDYLRPSDATRDLAVKLGLLPQADASDSSKLGRALKKLNTVVGSELDTLRGLEQRKACVNQTRFEGRLSGTSMASPAVAGYVARRVAEQLATLGRTDADVWDDAAFSPQALIALVVKDAPTFGRDVLIADVRKIVDILPWKPLDFLAGPDANAIADAGFAGQRPVFFVPLR